jgi:hypothetical protein
VEWTLPGELPLDYEDEHCKRHAEVKDQMNRLLRNSADKHTKLEAARRKLPEEQIKRHAVVQEQIDRLLLNSVDDTDDDDDVLSYVSDSRYASDSRPNSRYASDSRPNSRGPVLLRHGRLGGGVNKMIKTWDTSTSLPGECLLPGGSSRMPDDWLAATSPPGSLAQAFDEPLFGLGNCSLGDLKQQVHTNFPSNIAMRACKAAAVTSKGLPPLPRTKVMSLKKEKLSAEGEHLLTAAAGKRLPPAAVEADASHRSASVPQKKRLPKETFAMTNRMKLSRVAAHLRRAVSFSGL